MKSKQKKRSGEVPLRVTRKELTDAFWVCHKALGRQPTCLEINEYCTFKLRKYQKKFGSWGKFLSSIGLRHLKAAVSLKELGANYDAVKSDLGRVPKLTDFDKHGKYSGALYRKKFVHYRNYQVWRKDKVKRPKDVTTKEIIADYVAVKRRLGRVPLLREMKVYGSYKSSVLYERFGGYGAFLKMRKEKTYEELVTAEFRRIKKRLRRAPLGYEFTKLGKYNRVSVARHFGTWNTFLLLLGEKPRKRGRRKPEEKYK